VELRKVLSCPKADWPSVIQSRGALLAVVALSLSTKLGLLLRAWLMNPGAVWHPDSIAYQQLALNLVRSGQFSRSLSAPPAPELLRTPGYPLILALASSLTASPALLVLLLQVAAATGTVAMTWLLGRRLAGPRAGLMAALFVCLDVASVGTCLKLMTETFFALCIVAAVWFFLQGRPARAALVSFFLAGVSLGLAVLIRPVAYYLPLLALIPLLLPALRRVERRRTTLAPLAVFLVGPLLLIGGWHARNFVRAGTIAYSDQGAFNLLFYRAAGALAMSEHRDLFEVQHDLGFDNATGDYSEYLARRGGLRESGLSRRWTADAVKLAARHPWSFLAVTARGAAAFLFEPGSFEAASLLKLVTPDEGAELLRLLQLAPLTVPGYLLGRQALLLLTLYSILSLLLLYVGVGLWFRRRRGDKAAAAVMLAVIGYFVLVSAGPEARARFRVPVVPLLAVVAAAGLVGSGDTLPTHAHQEHRWVIGDASHSG